MLIRFFAKLLVIAIILIINVPLILASHHERDDLNVQNSFIINQSINTSFKVTDTNLDVCLTQALIPTSTYRLPNNKNLQLYFMLDPDKHDMYEQKSSTINQSTASLLNVIGSDIRLIPTTLFTPPNGKFVTFYQKGIGLNANPAFFGLHKPNFVSSRQYKMRIDQEFDKNDTVPLSTNEPRLFVGKVYAFFDNETVTGSAVALDDETVMTSAKWVMRNGRFANLVYYITYNSVETFTDDQACQEFHEVDQDIIAARNIHFPVHLEDKLEHQNENDFVILKFFRPINRLKNKSLAFLPTTVDTVDEYLLVGYNWSYRYFNVIDHIPFRNIIDKKSFELDDTNRCFIHYNCSNFKYKNRHVNEHTEGAPIFAKTSQGYYLIGLHYDNDNDSKDEKKALIFHHTLQQTVNLMRSISGNFHID